MTDLFISYARPDRSKIEPLVLALEKAGYSVWWDHEIVGGVAFAQEIERRLNAARAVVVAWSVHGLQSEWVMDEASAAKGAGKLVPISLDASQPPLGFRQHHVIDFSAWKGDSDAEAFVALCNSLIRYVRGQASAQLVRDPHEVLHQTANNTIAVLPLDNLSGDLNQQYFVDGMHEALISNLSKIRSLKVISRTSSRRYADSKKSLREIGAELGAGKLIEGSVAKEGSDVRISVQLVDVRSDTHLWSESFDRDVVNVLALLREVSRAIVDEVSVVLTPDERSRLEFVPKVSPVAYESYLRGMYHWYRLTPKDTEMAIEFFNQALAADTGFAAAHAALAMTWAGVQQMGVATTAVVAPKIKSSVEKALELNPDQSHAHLTLAAYYTWSAWDWDRAEPAFRRSIELNPNFPDAHAYYAHYLSIVGRNEEAESEIRQALIVDPFNPLVGALYVACLGFFQRWDDALAEADRVLAVVPDHWLIFQVQRFIYWHKGDLPNAFKATVSLYQTLGNAAVVEALEVSGATGDFETAWARAAETLAGQAEIRFVLPTQIAFLYGMAGDVDNTIDWIEKGFELHDPDLPYLRCIQRFPDDVMAHPRVQKVMQDFKYPAVVHTDSLKD